MEDRLKDAIPAIFSFPRISLLSIKISEQITTDEYGYIRGISSDIVKG